MQAIKEGVLGVVLQVSWPEHVVVELLELHSDLNHVLIVVFGHFSITLLDSVELIHQCAVCGGTAIHGVQGLHDAMQRAILIVHCCFGGVSGVPLQCTHDGVSDELWRMTFSDIVVNVTSPVIISDCII